MQLKCLKGPSVLSLSNMVSHHHSLDQSSFLLSVLSSSTGVPLSNNPRVSVESSFVEPFLSLVSAVGG